MGAESLSQSSEQLLSCQGSLIVAIPAVHLAYRYLKLSYRIHSYIGQLLHSLNVIYLAERTTFAAIFSSFKRAVSIRCFRIFTDNANRLNELNMLYARACT